ncbi:MAG: hypothetical protein KIPDCIKN_01529 [Haliscomenobacter sp.]|jgi:hypothetical protein|nr:hypothetical protein [Haliscomenobacter sp.]
MKKLVFCALCAALLSVSLVHGQTGKADPLVGTFTNKQAGLGLSVSPPQDGLYKGFFDYQGKRYPFTGFKLLGMLSGEYTFEGNAVAFSLAKIGDVFYVTSEGVSIDVERTSASPTPAGAPAEASTSSSSAPPSGKEVSNQAPPASGTRVGDPSSGYSFQLPASWTQTQENGSFIIKKTGLNAQIGLAPHNYSSLEEIRRNAFDVQDAESNTFLRATVAAYGANSLFIRYDGRAQGQAIVIEMISMVSPHGGGVSVVGSGAQADYSSQITTAMKTIANSVQFQKPQVSALAQQWKQRVSGKQLLFLQTGNGSSDKITIDLCPAGRFEYYSNSSYMSGGFSQFSYAGQDTNSGTWKIITRGSQPVLQLFFDSGSLQEYQLSTRQAGNEIGLNGQRYFIQPASKCP